MDSTEGERGKAIANFMDVPQGALVSGVENYSTLVEKGLLKHFSFDFWKSWQGFIPTDRSYTSAITAMPGSTFIFGNIGTVNQCRELKSRYKIQHQKYDIHIVDSNRRIALKEVKIDEFAVKLKLHDTMSPMDTFRDETRRHFQNLRGVEGQDIELSQLIDNDDRLTFIRGIAGMGKSVLAKQMTYAWANGDMYENFKLCIMFECREINRFRMTKGADFKTHEVISKFLKANFKYDLGDGHGVLFIIDGLDELYDITTDDSIIWQLLDIRNTEYVRSKLIITGRPHVEKYLERQDKAVGGIRKVEIQGLGDEQLKDYVNKFASSEDDIINIYKSKDSSKRALQIIHDPQFLNSFCCVAILSKGEKIRSTAELYCWTLYLLLKQHADKMAPSEKRISEVFREYSNDLLTLSEICLELLNENKVIFEGNIESRLYESGKGKEFLEGLFVNVSDNFSEKYQFKHLTLMEFLSAVYISSIENRMENIKTNLENEFYEVVLFSCQLVAGCKYNGIIKEMFANVRKFEEIDVDHFLKNILKLVRQCTRHERETFELSIDTIMCFMNKDISRKQFIISHIKELHRKKNASRPWNIVKLRDISSLLISEYEVCEEDLKEAFANVRVTEVTVDQLSSLTCIKYLANVERIDLIGITTSIRIIQEEVNKIRKCKSITMTCCIFEDDVVDNKIARSKMELLMLHECSLGKKAFMNLCNWGTSSVEELSFRNVNIEVKWWQNLVYAIAKAKETSSEGLTLKKLKIRECHPTMSEYIQMKIVQLGIELNIDYKTVAPTMQSSTQSPASSASTTSNTTQSLIGSKRRLNET